MRCCLTGDARSVWGVGCTTNRITLAAAKKGGYLRKLLVSSRVCNMTVCSIQFPCKLVFMRDVMSQRGKACKSECGSMRRG